MNKNIYSFLQASDLFPRLHVFASGLQELLVGQVEGLTDGKSYLLGLKAAAHSSLRNESTACGLIQTKSKNIRISRCRTRSTGACWTRSLCRWTWKSSCRFCRRRRRISCAADSCAARPAAQTRLICESCGNLVRAPHKVTHFCFGVQNLHAVDGDLQLHLGGLLTLRLLDVSLKLKRVKNNLLTRDKM